MDLSTLQPGQTLFDERTVISADDSAAYRAAVGDRLAIYEEDHVVPPLAVAALVMGAAMRAAELPGGAVHTGQELEFARPVTEGTELACSATVAQNTVRSGTRFLVLEVRGSEGAELAIRGRATIAISESAS